MDLNLDVASQFGQAGIDRFGHFRDAFFARAFRLVVVAVQADCGCTFGTRERNDGEHQAQSQDQRNQFLHNWVSS